MLIMARAQESFSSRDEIASLTHTIVSQLNDALYLRPSILSKQIFFLQRKLQVILVPDIKKNHQK